MRRPHRHTAKMFGASWTTSGLKLALILAAMAATHACGGESNAEKPFPPSSSPGSGGTSSTGSGGSGNRGPGSGGSTSTGSGGTSAASGGSSSTTGGSTSSGGTAPTGNCPARDSFTLAVHVTLDVTWNSATGTKGGAGVVHIWNRTSFTSNGLQLTGTTSSCGTILPEFELDGLGSAVAGGSKVKIEVPHEAWDSDQMPTFASNGVISGWDPGSSVDIEPTFGLVGIKMADPQAAWPSKWSSIKKEDLVDVDGDGKLGFTGVPRNDGTYVYPPASLGIAGSGVKAQKVYLISRTVLKLNGEITTCSEQSGKAEAQYFDSHVVGCQVAGSGNDCNSAETDFVDGGRTNYVVKPDGGAFRAKEVPENASCADVRAALPAE